MSQHPTRRPILGGAGKVNHKMAKVDPRNLLPGLVVVYCMACGEPFFADAGNRKTFIVRCRPCGARNVFCDSSEPLSILPPGVPVDLWFRDHILRSARQTVDLSNPQLLEVVRGRELDDGSNRTQNSHKIETETQVHATARLA